MNDDSQFVELIGTHFKQKFKYCIFLKRNLVSSYGKMIFLLKPINFNTYHKRHFNSIKHMLVTIQSLRFIRERKIHDLRRK